MFFKSQVAYVFDADLGVQCKSFLRSFSFVFLTNSFFPYQDLNWKFDSNWRRMRSAQALFKSTATETAYKWNVIGSSRELTRREESVFLREGCKAFASEEIKDSAIISLQHS